MPLGPGKYDDACTQARLSTDAVAVVLIVISGTEGNGFSVQTLDEGITDHLPTLLRVTADEVERSLRSDAR